MQTYIKFNAENYFFIKRTSCRFHCHCPYMINEVRQHLISGFSLFFMLWIMGAYALHFSKTEKRNVNYRKLLLFILLYLLLYVLWISYHVHTNEETVKGKHTSAEWLLQFQEFHCVYFWYYRLLYNIWNIQFEIDSHDTKI